MKTSARQTEQAKYVRAYAIPGYMMHGARLAVAQADLKALPARSTFLDVGCGRGEMLDYAESLGFMATGTEVVPELITDTRVVFGEAHKLPFVDGDFDVVGCFDVIEHLLPDDDELLCRELNRVAASHVLITANNESSESHLGEELHVNKRPYNEWDALFRQWFTGTVTRLGADPRHPTHRWRIDK